MDAGPVRHRPCCVYVDGSLRPSRETPSGSVGSIDLPVTFVIVHRYGCHPPLADPPLQRP